LQTAVRYGQFSRSRGERNTAAELPSALQIRRLQQGCRDLERGNRDLIAIVSRLGNDRTGLSLLRLYGHMRFRRELEHGCLLAFI
jgi:hypothetical protein